MDPFYAMMSMEDIPEEQKRALARTLQQRSSGGAHLATSALPEVAKQGQLMQAQGKSMADRIGTQEYYKQSQKNALARTLAKGGGSKFPKASNSAMNKFESQANMMSDVRALESRWRDEYSSVMPFETLANAENAIARRTGMGDEAQAEWWSDFKSLYENIQRHELFGSALTEAEKAEWKRSNPNPTDTPQMTRSKMATIAMAQQKVAAKAAQNALNKEWDPTYVHGVYQHVLPDEAWGDLDAYAGGMQKQMEKGTQITDRAVTELSTEELLEQLFK